MATSSPGATVLLVEDDAAIADMYRLQLDRDGFCVDVAHNGEQALQRLRQAPVDLVLLDVQMPKIDGWGVLQELGSRGPGGPKVIMMSSFSDPEMVTRAIRMGASDWLIKAHITPGELSRRLGFWVRALDRQRTSVKGEDFESISDSEGRPFSASATPILVADDYATYVAANPAALALLGCGPSDVIGKRVWDFTPGGSVATGLEMWRQFIARGETRGRYELIRPDGRRVQARYRAVANVRPGRHVSFLEPLA